MHIYIYMLIYYIYITVYIIYIYIYIYIKTRSDKSISSNSLFEYDLPSIILKNNYFENEELKYHQKRGFPFGTKFDPTYSKLFMAMLEKIIFQSI